MLLLAVSGGVDSMCLAEKVRLEGGPFAIAHCNFSLRGEESDSDEAFVRSWAEKHGIVCHIRRFDTAAFAAAEGISTEMAARRLRYHWFGQLCRKHAYSAVAVAHNANDNAETLLLNLLRGTGLRGITGMKASAFLPDPAFGDIPLLRPLLDLTRDEIIAYARSHGLSWREDSSNASSEYKRNRIRNEVFPIFARINPRFVETLNRDMKRFREALAGETAVPEKTETAPLPLPDFGWQEEPWDGTQPLKQAPGVLIADVRKLGERYFWGRWEAGDWIKPLGAPGRKKLQDWFTDHHIPRWQKPLIPLLKNPADPHHVLAIAGHCIDHSVRVTADTDRILRIYAKND